MVFWRKKDKAQDEQQEQQEQQAPEEGVAVVEESIESEVSQETPQ